MAKKTKSAQDIDLKFSAFAHHIFGVNWQKNSNHCSISGSVVPSSMQKLWTPLKTIFVEKKFWKKLWCGFRPILVIKWKDFLMPCKNGDLWFFKQVHHPEPVFMHPLNESAKVFKYFWSCWQYLCSTSVFINVCISFSSFYTYPWKGQHFTVSAAVLTRPSLCNKMALFREASQPLKVLLYP